MKINSLLLLILCFCSQLEAKEFKIFYGASGIENIGNMQVVNIPTRDVLTLNSSDYVFEENCTVITIPDNFTIFSYSSEVSDNYDETYVLSGVITSSGLNYKLAFDSLTNTIFLTPFN